MGDATEVTAAVVVLVVTARAVIVLGGKCTAKPVMPPINLLPRSGVN